MKTSTTNLHPPIFAHHFQWHTFPYAVKHPLKFTRLISPTYFHPRIFTHQFSPTLFHQPVSTYTKAANEIRIKFSCGKIYREGGHHFWDIRNYMSKEEKCKETFWNWVFTFNNYKKHDIDRAAKPKSEAIHPPNSPIFTHHFHQRAFSYTPKHNCTRSFSPSYFHPRIFTHQFSPTIFHPKSGLKTMAADLPSVT